MLQYLSFTKRKIINIQPASTGIGYKIGYEYISRDTNAVALHTWFWKRTAILLKINGCKWSNRTVASRAHNVFHCHARQNKHIAGLVAFKLDIVVSWGGAVPKENTRGRVSWIKECLADHTTNLNNVRSDDRSRVTEAHERRRLQRRGIRVYKRG